MSPKTYIQVSGTLFAIVGMFHLLRVVLNYPLVYGVWNIPQWASLLAGAGLWYLAYLANKLGTKKK